MNMPEQWMENEWMVQVPFQEETVWYPSFEQQKLHPRHRRFSYANAKKILDFLYFVVIAFCAIFPLWIVLGGFFYLITFMNSGVVYAMAFLIACLGLVLIHYVDPKKL